MTCDGRGLVRDVRCGFNPCVGHFFFKNVVYVVSDTQNTVNPSIKSSIFYTYLCDWMFMYVRPTVHHNSDNYKLLSTSLFGTEYLIKTLNRKKKLQNYHRSCLSYYTGHQTLKYGLQFQRKSSFRLTFRFISMFFSRLTMITYQDPFKTRVQS